MENNVKESLNKEYGLELLECVLKELAKIPGFERLALVTHANDFIANEYKKEADALLSGDNGAGYTEQKSKLEALLQDKREQIIKILDIETLPF